MSETLSLWKRFTAWRSQQKEKRPPKEKNPFASLQIAHPARFTLIHNAEEKTHYFQVLRDTFHERFMQKRGDDDGLGPPLLLYESGRMASGDRYFYLKPPNRPGWLFEESFTGWTVSHSEKIVNEALFLRDADPWDQVSLHVPVDPPKDARRLVMPRVSSQLSRDGGLVSFAFYASEMEKEILHS